MKNILDKINKADEIQANKVELGTHEVELSLIDDAEKLNKELNSLSSNARKTLDEFLKFRAKLVDDRKKIDQLYNALDIATTRLVKAENELGIEIPNLAKYQATRKNANDVFNVINANLK